MLVAGLFGHRHTSGPQYAQWHDTAAAWFHTAIHWCSTHWTTLAVVIPVAGAIAAGVMNHFLAVARENRGRRLALRDVRARVYADLSVRLLSHCSALQGVMRGGPHDLDAWRERNAALRTRSESEDVIQSLGREYVHFVAAIEHERRALANFSRRQPRFTARDVVKHYVPFIAEFGQSDEAGRLRKLAR